MRRFVLAAATTLLLGALISAAYAECVPVEELSAAPSTEAAHGTTSTDSRGRVVAPVMINGQGPYRFIVDTGANRSVIAQHVAESLGLAPIGSGEVHAIQSVTVAPLVEVDSFTYRDIQLPTGPIPLLQGRVLAGEHGLLGADAMTGRRLRLDFERRCLEISPARRARRLQGWEMVRGELHFGHLVVLPGRVGDLRVNVFLDTGSDSTLANFALRDALRRQITYDPAALDFARVYNAGEPVVLDSAVVLPRLRIGPLNANDVLAYVGDFHIFRLAGLNDEPTLLIGMDVLRRARAIAIDYDRARVYFRLRGVRPMISMRPA